MATNDKKETMGKEASCKPHRPKKGGIAGWLGGLAGKAADELNSREYNIEKQIEKSTGSSREK